MDTAVPVLLLLQSSAHLSFFILHWHLVAAHCVLRCLDNVNVVPLRYGFLLSGRRGNYAGIRLAGIGLDGRSISLGLLWGWGRAVLLDLQQVAVGWGEGGRERRGGEGGGGEGGKRRVHERALYPTLLAVFTHTVHCTNQ